MRWTRSRDAGSAPLFLTDCSTDQKRTGKRTCRQSLPAQRSDSPRVETCSLRTCLRRPFHSRPVAHLTDVDRSRTDLVENFRNMTLTLDQLPRELRERIAYCVRGVHPVTRGWSSTDLLNLGRVSSTWQAIIQAPLFEICNLDLSVHVEIVKHLYAKCGPSLQYVREIAVALLDDSPVTVQIGEAFAGHPLAEVDAMAGRMEEMGDILRVELHKTHDWELAKVLRRLDNLTSAVIIARSRDSREDYVSTYCVQALQSLSSLTSVTLINLNSADCIFLAAQIVSGCRHLETLGLGLGQEMDYLRAIIDEHRANNGDGLMPMERLSREHLVRGIYGSVNLTVLRVDGPFLWDLEEDVAGETPLPILKHFNVKHQLKADAVMRALILHSATTLVELECSASALYAASEACLASLPAALKDTEATLFPVLRQVVLDGNGEGAKVSLAQLEGLLGSPLTHMRVIGSQTGEAVLALLKHPRGRLLLDKLEFLRVVNVGGPEPCEAELRSICALPGLDLHYEGMVIDAAFMESIESAFNMQPGELLAELTGAEGADEEDWESADESELD